ERRRSVRRQGQRELEIRSRNKGVSRMRITPGQEEDGGVPRRPPGGFARRRRRACGTNRPSLRATVSGASSRGAARPQWATWHGGDPERIRWSSGCPSWRRPLSRRGGPTTKNLVRVVGAAEKSLIPYARRRALSAQLEGRFLGFFPDVSRRHSRCRVRD